MKKGLVVKSGENTDSDMKLINEYSRRTLNKDEVYTFSVVLCDNDIDRDFERFTVEGLFALQKLFLGKTGILDHNPTAKNQTARIYYTEVESVEGKVTQNGDQYFRLVARAYIPKSDNLDEFIQKIDTGIMREVSVGCGIERTVCSICGNDIHSVACSHQKGKTYDGTLCFGELTNPTDAYEWSFVAVPAQRNAGVIKSFKEGEKSMESIIECLKSEKDFTLGKTEKGEILSYIRSLEKEAQDGREYRNTLVAEVKKFSLLSKCGISSETMDSIVNSLSVKELCELRDIYEKRADSVVPAVPQTYAGNNNNRESNEGFTI
ncbi:MAG: hypothetical protein ACI4HL_03185 [Ruminococcus sp.]